MINKNETNERILTIKLKTERKGKDIKLLMEGKINVRVLMEN